MKKYKTLESFFSVSTPKTEQNENSSISRNEEINRQTPVSSESVTSNCSAVAPEDFQVVSNDTCNNDISLFVSTKTKLMSDAEKVQVLRNIWTPSSNYTFSEQKSGNKMRRFQLSGLEKFHWLAYSKDQNGAYCKFCVLFPPTDFASGKGGHQPLGGLVIKPYRNLKDVLENFRAHEIKGYHKTAALRGENICDIVDQKKDSVILQLDKKRKLF